MRLGQILFGNLETAAIVKDGSATPIPGHRLLELIERHYNEKEPLTKLASRMATHHSEQAPLLIPIRPPEVWACGCTYEPSAAFRDADHQGATGIYHYVYSHPRPEIFMKGTARVCVGPGEPIGIRADSKFTAPEPELALVLGRKGDIIGYTLANDVSAWDIERENPLYLPQSKIYAACCAIGPVVVTKDEIPDPYAIELTCVIRRGDREVFSGSVSTAKMNRKFEELVDYLIRSNPVPSGTVVLTGTGIIAPEDARLEPGDVVTIASPQVGELSNPVVVVE